MKLDKDWDSTMRMKRLDPAPERCWTKPRKPRYVNGWWARAGLRRGNRSTCLGISINFSFQALRSSCGVDGDLTRIDPETSASLKSRQVQ